jgi:hypothetical protein
MNGRRARTLRREVSTESLGQEVDRQGEFKVTAKTEQINEHGELVNMVETQTGVLGCSHVSSPAALCGRCQRSLCEKDSRVICYACGTVCCEACRVESYSGKVSYHRGRCRLIAFFIRLAKG